jgi:hypothetical protein
MPTQEQVVVAEETGQGEGEAERVVQTLSTAPQANRTYKPRDSTYVYDPIYDRLISELAEQLYGYDNRYVHWWCYFWFPFVVAIIERRNNPEYSKTRKLVSYFSIPTGLAILPGCVEAVSCGPTRYSAAVPFKLWIHSNVVTGVLCRLTRYSAAYMGIHSGES